VAQQESACQADAAAGAAKRRALQSADHPVAVVVEARPKDGPGRPRQKPPRVVKARRYGRQVTRQARSEVSARKTQETGGFVLLTHVPPAGEMAPRAEDVLRANQEPHGLEQHFSVLKDPLMVTSLFLKKPARIAALGLV
jgi:hypothetical protein